MLKKSLSLMLIGCMAFSLIACSSTKEESNKEVPKDQSTTEVSNEPSGSVMLYSSLKEDQLEAIKTGFTNKYPNIKMDYYAAGTSKVATKIATEKQSGQIACDVIWIGDPSNYITLKEKGILEAYESPEAVNIDATFKDPDNYYVGGRLVVMGFAYNTNNVTESEAPKVWSDLLKPEFKDQIVMTDPGESGTTFYTVAALMAKDGYGLDYFKQLKEQGAELESGTTSTHTKVAANAYKVCIAVDYVTQTLEKDGSTIKFVYPDQELIAISSPIGLVKDSKNTENGKLLYDYIISVEGQEILAANDCSPIRKDVVKEGALTIDEIVGRATKVDDAYIADHSTEILDNFDEIFK